MNPHDDEFEASLRAQVSNALHEDIGSGDITGQLLDADTPAKAELIFRDSAVLCGTRWLDEVYAQLDDNVATKWLKVDGDAVDAGSIVCFLQGPAPALLAGERTALNFVQTLSATSTATREFTHALTGSDTQLLDTRKTLPGLRVAQKYAVRCGGGENHRIGLFDAFLIKENHIAAAGGIAAACARARSLHAGALLQVEVESLDQLQQAIDAKVDRIMLDNFSLDQTLKAVRIANGCIPLEASGDINLDSIGQIAATGVDYVSIGAITKHIHAVDLSLRIID